MSKNKGNNTNKSFFDGYDEATDYIFHHLPENYDGEISEDVIEYVLQHICEYYDQAGLIDESKDDVSDESENVEENDIFDFIKAALQKDNIVEIDDDVLQTILDGEFDYGVSIGMYKEA